MLLSRSVSNRHRLYLPLQAYDGPASVAGIESDKVDCSPRGPIEGISGALSSGASKQAAIALINASAVECAGLLEVPDDVAPA
jgi:hypothetical protein